MSNAGEILTWPADVSGQHTGAASMSLRRSPMSLRVRQPQQMTPEYATRVVGRCKKGVNHQRLQYIKGIRMIEMRPGLTQDGSTLFVLTSRESVSHCIRVGTSLVICNFDDNKTRFHFQDTTSFPIAVSTPECDIGDIDDDSAANYDIAIDYYDLATDSDNEEDVLAWYQIQYQDESIGEILIRPGLITFTFDMEAEVEHKALCIAYGINRALSVHSVELEQSKQLQEMYEEVFQSLHENVFPLMENVILRAVGQSMGGDKHHLFLMDYNNQNKIVVIATYDENANTYTALDVSGNILFQTFEVAEPKPVMHVNQQNICIGTSKETGVGNSEVQLKLANGEVLTCDSLSSRNTECSVVDSHNNVMSKVTNSETIDPRRSTVKIIFSKILSTNAKKLILSYIINVAFKVFELHKALVPRIKLSKPVPFPFSVFEAPTKVSRGNSSVTTMKGSYPRPFTFRAAGYNIISGVHYYDVISDNGKICLTMEHQPPSETSEYGMLIAKNNHGGALFVVPDFLRANGMTVYDGNGHLLGYQSGDIFFNCTHVKAIVVEEQKDSKDPNKSMRYFKKGNSSIGVISQSDFGFTLAVSSAPLSQRYLMLAYTAKLYQRPELDSLPLPQIDYKYVGEKLLPAEY